MNNENNLNNSQPEDSLDRELESASGGVSFWKWAVGTSTNLFKTNIVSVGKGLASAIKDGDGLVDGYMHAVDADTYSRLKLNESKQNAKEACAKLSDNIQQFKANSENKAGN